MQYLVDIENFTLHELKKKIMRRKCLVVTALAVYIYMRKKVPDLCIFELQTSCVM